MATLDLQAQVRASAHLSHFRASSGHQKPFKIQPKVFVPKTVPKICNNFTDTYDREMKLYRLTDMTKMNIYSKIRTF